MMADMPLPPWLRKIQQSYYWQVLCLPLLVGFGGALLTNGCLARGIFDIDVACLKGAVSSYILMTIGIYISGHSPGSASFNADGTPNQTVAKVVATDAATVAVKEAIKVNKEGV